MGRLKTPTGLRSVPGSGRRLHLNPRALCHCGCCADWWVGGIFSNYGRHATATITPGGPQDLLLRARGLAGPQSWRDCSRAQSKTLRAGASRGTVGPALEAGPWAAMLASTQGRCGVEGQNVPFQQSESVGLAGDKRVSCKNVSSVSVDPAGLFSVTVGGSRPGQSNSSATDLGTPAGPPATGSKARRFQPLCRRRTRRKLTLRDALRFTAV